MTPIRTSRFAVAAALLTGITGFAASASATPAAGQPPAVATLAGATALALAA